MQGTQPLNTLAHMDTLRPNM